MYTVTYKTWALPASRDEWREGVDKYPGMFEYGGSGADRCLEGHKNMWQYRWAQPQSDGPNKREMGG